MIIRWYQLLVSVNELLLQECTLLDLHNEERWKLPYPFPRFIQNQVHSQIRSIQNQGRLQASSGDERE
jgi:hypothetical protein